MTPLFFYVQSVQNVDFCEAAFLSSGFNVEKSTISAVSVDGNSPAGTVATKTQIQYTFSSDPGTGIHRITGFLSY